MADIEVGDLVARITLDDTGIDKSLAQIQREMKLVASEFEKASASLEAFGSEEDKLRAKSDQLTKQIALQGQRVELLRQEFKKAAQEKGEDAVATQKLATQLNKAEAALAKMQAELKQVNKELADQPSRMAKWSSGLKDFGNHLQAAGQEIATSFGVAGAAISAALGYAVNTAADFEAQMDRVGAIAEASSAELEAMTKTAMELGASTSKSASEVAQGMEMMAAMGFKANEIIAAMPGVIAAAEASGQDMALVADTMAVALRSFGLEASQATHVSDVLAQTANKSAANIEGMAYVLKYAAAPAHTLGMSLEELAASAAIMADAGIRGETAGTTLRSALLSLTAPSKEASKELEKLKVRITDAQGNMHPFADIIAQLKTGMQGWGNAQKAAALETLFGKEAVSGMMAVIEAGPEKIRALTAELQNSTGASAQAAAQIKDNLKGALEQLSGAFETMQITIGNALIPVIQSLAGALQSVVDWFNQLDPSVQQFIALSAAAGAALLTLIGAFGAVMATVGLASLGLGELGISLSTVAAAILPVTAAIAGLTAAGVLLYQNWDTISKYAKVAWDGIVSVVKPAVDEVASFITKTFGDLATWWKSIWPDLQVAFMNIWNAILAYTRPTLETIKAVFDAVWPYIKNITVAVWEAIKGVITAAINAIKGSMELFIGVFTGDWDRALNGAKMSIQAGWDAIKSIFSSAIQVILNIAGGLVSGIAAYFGQIGKQMAGYGGDIVKGLGEGIQSMATWVKEKVLSLVTAISNTVKEFFGIASPSRLMAEYGRYIVEGLWEGIQSMASWIKSNVTQFASNIANTLKEFFGIASPSRLMAEYGRYIAEGLAIGIEQNKGKPIQQADLMAQAINGALGKLQNELKLTAQIAQAEFDLIAAKMQDSGSESETLKAKYELLTQQLDIQNQTVAVLRQAYEDMKATKGANMEETQKLYLELLKEQTAYQGLKKELQEVEQQLKKATSAKIEFLQADGKNFFRNDNGHWVEIGDTGPYNPVIYDDEGKVVSRISDWLDTSNNGGGEEKRDKGRNPTDPNDKDYKNDDRYTWDEDKGRWWDNEDGGWEGSDIFDSFKSETKKAAKDIGDSIKDVFDKVKDAFKFPGLATGGTVTKSGWTWVGENGPELLRLPRGAQVIPNYDIPRVGGGSSVTNNFQFDVHISGPVYGISDLKEKIRHVIKTDTLPIITQQLRQPARARG
ncbi:phage tail tape measure protein [Brevibacillus sp. LEMMJ03]|uniref:phage tail tape measure protein n=1 Tax=Brevibacillus sp. LEMMJ03 TaxID=2595056 RepID=UPI0011812059|nr:phage tail tape measure protein [Brevibacillus sp. LEMMJ03]TRY27438.1 phage tail tape measure protein [Brevibacillus sp. LEMMJ03]